jgi:hypothetical protein
MVKLYFSDEGFVLIATICVMMCAIAVMYGLLLLLSWSIGHMGLGLSNG